MSNPAIQPDLRDLPPQGVQDLLVALGEKPFRARQVLRWLYLGGARDFAEMTDLSKNLRARLAQTARLTDLAPAEIHTSADGTRKLLYELEDGARIEGVLIPEEDHHTLCVSSQVGCRMGCKFCRTGALGFTRHLRPAEIVGQVLAARRLVDQARPLTNLVFMGMGEPLDNLDHLLVALGHILGEHGLQMSQRRVTISTVGLADRLADLGANSPAALAVSLNAPNDALRSRLMPVNRRFSLATLKAALLAYPLKPTRRVTLEYVLLGGVNDRPEQALELAMWCRGLKCKVNLIPFNPHEGAGFQAPDEATVLAFQRVLIDNNLTALFRRSRGAEIGAACGQLAARATAEDDEDRED
ncbi:MAG: 23S rRNA (adenine(2503)-C(2))-methyltransferase RlmN [Desulfarculus sp.]|nr:23S rRNA (adenine(2503)-C(2))-methyltransferase RlmN [Desulfarculus sp.]